MHQYVQSRYTIMTPLLRGRSLAYNSLSGALAVMEAHDRDAYDRVGERRVLPTDEESITQLAYGGFIVDEATDELEIIRRQYNAHRYDMSTMILTVAPTLACNFGCDYCFQGQDKPNAGMREDVQEALLGLIGRVTPAIRRLHIAWYGGEPLLRKDLIESLSDQVIAHCEANKLIYDAMIVTNGYFLDPEVARMLTTRRVKSAQVTLDGLPSYHDARRHLHSKKGTFAKILHNLRDVVHEVPELRISVRVNIDDRNRDDIAGLIDLLAEEGLGGKDHFKMYFAPIEAMTEGCHGVESVTMSKARYAQLEAELYRHGYRAGLTGLPYPPRFHGTCAAVRPRGFVIVPSGDIHKCWDTVSDPSRRVGTLFDLEALNSDELSHAWIKWTPFNNETCRNCRILPNCAGACAYKFVHSGSQRGEAAILPCPSWKYNIRERLLLRAVETGALSQADYDVEQSRTDPTLLCADVHVAGGNALPAEMQALYQKISGKKSRSLPVLSTSPAEHAL
ncbi:MAG: TIGR04463 family radical SAM/SPASM RiPP maturase [Myxococcales bacterium]|nr:TIGR04463 family radical SAM/SPASM RiPP maturase [Myxococcales bacterium]